MSVIGISSCFRLYGDLDEEEASNIGTGAHTQLNEEGESEDFIGFGLKPQVPP